MLVLPGVDEKNFAATEKCFRDVLALIKNLPEAERWVHVDVTDGTFTPNSYWHNVAELPKLRPLADAVKVKIEIHLMIARPECQLGDWLRSGADRVVIHAEALEFKDIPIMLGEAVVLGVVPATPIERLIVSAEYAKQVLFLAVKPGFSGGKFDESTLDKIRVLQKRRPNVTIEVDGGMNLETARGVVEAGAQMIVSTSYIRDHADPKKALELLRRLQSN